MKYKVRAISILIYLVFVFGVFSTVKFDISEPPYNYGSFGEDFTVSISSSNYANATVISDDGTKWNDGYSSSPSIAIDNGGNLHVVWDDRTNGPWGTDQEIMYADYSALAGWSNATVISDDGTKWNNGDSNRPSIAIDNGGSLHVVWKDVTDGPWGNDPEIMYANYSSAGWSNATVISDDVSNWNNGDSNSPSIAVDNGGNVHVVWFDSTDGPWGTDDEIMYVNYSSSVGWSNATVISDDGTKWNDDYSSSPSIAVDNSGNVHVVWFDFTDGPWGTDAEIMYADYSALAGWSNATVISDDGTKWNDDYSSSPSIAVDNGGNLHVVWFDSTDGPWGTDSEIMYADYSSTAGWSNATVISDDGTKWNDGSSSVPSISIDNGGNVHVVWYDWTDGPWTGGGNGEATDAEIMYADYSSTAGWSNATVISDGYGGIYWNDHYSRFPSIVIDNGGNVHVVWEDSTEGPWGDDYEIMYTSITIPGPVDSSTQGIPFGNSYILFILVGIIGIIIYIKRKV